MSLIKAPVEMKRILKFSVFILAWAVLICTWSVAHLPAFEPENLSKSERFDASRSAHALPMERISPVILAYYRLVGVLKAHSNPQDIPFILSDTKRALSNPLSLPSLVQKITDPMEPVWFHQRIENQYIRPDRLLQEFALKTAKRFYLYPHFSTLPMDALEKTQDVISIERLMDFMTRRVHMAGQSVKAAFTGISPEEKVRLLRRFPRVLDAFFKDGNFSDPDAFSIIDKAKNIRMAQMLEGLYGLSNVFSHDFLNSVQVALSQTSEVDLDHEKYPGLGGKFLLIRETPVGLILVGDRGPNVYGTHASVIFDLGGDDLYLNNAGAPVYELQENEICNVSHPVLLIVDFDGNDRYLNPGFAAVGSGFFGLGILLDRSGNDIYSGGRLSLGAAFFGMGCLMDLSGNDTYITTEGGQGAALFGGALLFDGGGNDLYQGAKYVQGFGGSRGFGELLDLQGNDRYRAGWKYGSSYGTKGIFQGCSQGLGWGFRNHAAGGIGILHDLSGDDIYEAGNFSQGTGYYLGLGVLRDDAGNDIYRGSRYCQGSSAHEAAGALLDFEGDDIYSGKIAANQGAAWDLSVACLVDYAGNDRYTAGDLSLGAAAQNGMGMFFDAKGCDRYESPKRSLGFSGDLSYGGGRNAGNMGIFLDMGGDGDIYENKNRRNELFSVNGNMGIFLDE